MTNEYIQNQVIFVKSVTTDCWVQAWYGEGGVVHKIIIMGTGSLQNLSLQVREGGGVIKTRCYRYRGVVQNLYNGYGGGGSCGNVRMGIREVVRRVFNTGHYGSMGRDRDGETHHYGRISYKSLSSYSLTNKQIALWGDE